MLIVLPVAWLLTLRLEGDAPVFSISPDLPVIGAAKELSVTASDPNSGLRRIWIGLLKGDKEIVLFEKDYPGGNPFLGGSVREAAFKIRVEPKKMGISEGKAILRIMVRDYSWRQWWHGNRTYREIETVIDTRPPGIEALTRVHNVNQGGTGLVIYRLSEPCRESGVLVGENFFPGHLGYFGDKEIAMAFFALDHGQGKGTRIMLRAVDRAGNSANAGFPHHIRRRRFKKDTIRISDQFLNWKMPEFAGEIDSPADDTLVNRFLAVNRQLRQKNFLVIQSVGADTKADLLWDGKFLRLPNSATRSKFADYREYLYNGKVIDHQVHLGVDLASIAHSPVPAANSGRISFAGSIGIYGKTIMIDHGFGLFSMYSHLSSIDVQTGQLVSKKEIIGRTGRTGLAGGDHLHFSMLVHNVFVNPLEWWDGSWIHNNITSKINATRP